MRVDNKGMIFIMNINLFCDINNETLLSFKAEYISIIFSMHFEVIYTKRKNVIQETASLK